LVAPFGPLHAGQGAQYGAIDQFDETFDLG
jgi:hypothetical protein